MTGLAAFTLFHVVLSLIGILSGFVVLLGLIRAQPLDRWTAIFLITTAATSVTGFFFPFHKLLPSHILGILSLITLAIAVYARYSRHIHGAWRGTYVVTAVLALYFNVFVLIVQAFQKIPALKVLAPNQNEPPFAITQITCLVLFIVLCILAMLKFKVAPAHAA